jgi:hypothetical protein
VPVFRENQGCIGRLGCQLDEREDFASPRSGFPPGRDALWPAELAQLARSAAANSAILDDHLFGGTGPRRRPAEVIALVDEEDLPENHRSR